MQNQSIDELYAEAIQSVSDEGVFSQDQINSLRRAFSYLKQAIDRAAETTK